MSLCAGANNFSIALALIIVTCYREYSLWGTEKQMWSGWYEPPSDNCKAVSSDKILHLILPATFPQSHAAISTLQYCILFYHKRKLTAINQPMTLMMERRDACKSCDKIYERQVPMQVAPSFQGLRHVLEPGSSLHRHDLPGVVGI